MLFALWLYGAIFNSKVRKVCGNMLVNCSTERRWKSVDYFLWT